MWCHALPVGHGIINMEDKNAIAAHILLTVMGNHSAKGAMLLTICHS